MAVPNVDTFENDITDEIKHKEATIGDIASASGDIGNAPQSQKIFPILSVLISIFILIITAVVLYFGYNYYSKKINPPVNTAPVQILKNNDTSLLQNVSPLFPDALGRFVTNVEQKPSGYILTLTNTFTTYSSVFAYMIKNESEYADDIANAVGSGRDTSTTTPLFKFSDTTINNQNMRVGTSGSNIVVYAFINTQALVISSSTEGIFSLRGDILH